MDVIPFSVNGLLGGIARADGGAKCENDVLTLEFKVQNGVVGLYKSAAKRVIVPLHILDLVRLDGGHGNAELVLRAHSRIYLDGMPGRRRAEVKLRIGSEHLPNAERLIKEMERRMAEVG